MADVKVVEKKAEAAAKMVDKKAKAEEVKAVKAVKAVEKKAEPVKPAAEKKVPAEKEAPAPKKAPETKKEAAPKKAATVKKAEPKTAVVVEYMGTSINTKDILDKAKKAYEKANKGVEIKTIDLYVKPEEAVAYYVVNGIGSDEYKVII